MWSLGQSCEKLNAQANLRCREKGGVYEIFHSYMECICKRDRLIPIAFHHDKYMVCHRRVKKMLRTNEHVRLLVRSFVGKKFFGNSEFILTTWLIKWPLLVTLNFRRNRYYISLKHQFTHQAHYSVTCETYFFRSLKRRFIGNCFSCRGHFTWNWALGFKIEYFHNFSKTAYILQNLRRLEIFLHAFEIKCEFSSWNHWQWFSEMFEISDLMHR